MAGGLLNLVAEGSQNIVLNGNPTASFFKSVYKKYTNFGLQKFRIDYNGLRKLNYKEPTKLTFKVPRYAELLMDTYIVVNIPNIWSGIIPPQDCSGTWLPYEFKWIPNLGFNMISEVEISVGGQILQKFSGDYLLNQMRRDFSGSKVKLTEDMIGNVPEMTDPASVNGGFYPNAYYTPLPSGAEPSIRGRKLYIPLNSWFALNSRMAFPLVCLQYNELHITVTFRPVYQLFQIRDVDGPTAQGDDAVPGEGFINRFGDVNVAPPLPPVPNKKSKYWGYPINKIPYVAPSLNNKWHYFYRFLQTPPSANMNPEDFGITSDIWNADVHIISTYAFLSRDETNLFAKSCQKYLIKEVFETQYPNVYGAFKADLRSMGMVSDWMMFFRRSDAPLRNEWNNYSNWAYPEKPRGVVSLAPSYGNAMEGPWLPSNPATNPSASVIEHDTGSNVLSRIGFYEDLFNGGLLPNYQTALNLGTNLGLNSTVQPALLSTLGTLGMLPSSASNTVTKVIPGINPSGAEINGDCKEGGVGNFWKVGGTMPYTYPPIKISGNYSAANQKDILLNMGILLDGKYRENVFDAGVYQFSERYTRTNGGGFSCGLYCYDFCLDTSYLRPGASTSVPQPTGAINLSKFSKVELEMNTYTPPLDEQAQTNVICDGDGNLIGINKGTWDIYKYTYVLTVMESRYNIVNFVSGNAGLEWAR